MATLSPHKPQSAWKLKGKIIAKYGSMKNCARALNVTTEGIRKSFSGKCPGIARKLQEVLQ